MPDVDMGIVAEIVEIIERKVAANNLVKARSGNLIAVVSLVELGLGTCPHEVSTLVVGKKNLKNCKVIDSRTDGDAFMFCVKPY